MTVAEQPRIHRTAPRRRIRIEPFNWPGLVAVVLILLLWQLPTWLGIQTLQYLSSPVAIIAAFFELITTGALLPALAHTLTAVVVAWAISVVVGVTFGAILGNSRSLATYTLASIEVLRALPTIAFVPVAMLLFGFSIDAAIVLAVFGTVWPVIVNTAAGTAGIHPRLREVARSMRLSRWAFMWKIVLPAAAPQILVAARLGMAVAMILVIITEMVGIPYGLGYAVVRSQESLRADWMWAYVFTIGLVGVILNALIVYGMKALLPGARLGGKR